MAAFMSSMARTVLLFLSLLVLFTTLSQAQQCSASIPCQLGCCSKFGFCGYGKDFCAKEICVNNCQSKAECDPGGYGDAFVEKTKCPLNVCCSKHGFCGSTEEFCGGKKIAPPSCGSGHSLSRVVGYYEGWAGGRPCNDFMPEQIPLGVYTHLNFAFATVNPKTFEVLPSSASDVRLYKRLASLKKQDPDLKVMIAIGGWTFNDPGPTATTFSDIAGSESAQKAFIKSLISMMSTYDFDGVDLDWEYPVAKDRSGRDEDFKNFPEFLKNLKQALKSTGGRDEVSLTLPASFWYLQHFDIAAIEKHIDFFNIMSYDLHGTWDKTNKWVGPYLNAHTNMTEIKDAMNLLWRNDINPNKVVMGTGFYGRAFTATSPNCLTPGCTYESGAPRQPCSREISVMIQSEIVDIMKRTGRTPVLDKEAAVKILTFDNNQWVAFDDEDTFKMKADFAREQCLSGIMVWAVSHDVADGKYSKVIGRVSDRKNRSIPAKFMEEDGLIETSTAHPQCKWTNCGESCPSGWIRMMRKDKEARKDEYMVDDSNCSSGVHELCCPPDDGTPTCGWYQHNNGGCEVSCPSGAIEIGSHSGNCNNNKYQAACCTTGSKSMELHDQCSWTEAPMCMNGFCSSGQNEVALSPTGSGGAVCNMETFSWGGGGKVQERKLCCNEKDDKKWDDCQWYDNLGFGKDQEGWCRSGCPNDRVRVSMDKYWNKDSAFGCRGGARSRCCIPKYATIIKRESSQDEILRDALTAFLKEPVCASDGPGWTFSSVSRRDLSMSASEMGMPKEEKRQAHVHMHKHGHGHRHGHHRRDSGHQAVHGLQVRAESFGNFAQDEVKGVVYALLLRTATSNQKAIWNTLAGKRFPSLEWDTLWKWIEDKGKIKQYGYDQLAYLITCHMSDFNKWVKGNKTNTCVCDTVACCPGGGLWCASEDSAPDDPIKRRKRWEEEAEDLHQLEKRAPGDGRPYRIRLPSGQYVTVTSGQYYPATHNFWFAAHPVWDNVYLYPNTDCLDVYPVINRWAPGRGGVHYEHEIEGNTIARFFTHALAGTLPSGRRMTTPRLSPSLVDRTLIGRFTTMPPPMVGGANSDSPMDRIFNALGSTTNTQHAVFVQAGINLVKTALWQQSTTGGWLNSWMSVNNMNDAMRDLPNYQDFAARLQMVIVGINYLRDPLTFQRLVSINFDIRDELRRLQNEHRLQTGISDNVVAAWDEFIRDLLEETLRTARDFVQGWVTTARNEYRDQNDEEVIAFLAVLSTLLRHSFDLDLPLHLLP
ncbi:hypothetical protein FAUST_11765 [Fusarium austroamericanum]|uniref:chitinase n=2 Tax=Fusarium sambucinum species complex TaxID=569360 RepID=A0AAN5YY88_FUSAU|nr:hypothetical protein FAUST_11765 [Fusarium austroamericanum]